MSETSKVLRTIEVDKPDDTRLADYTRLTDASLRTHFEAEHGLFIAEGTKVITRAVAAGYPVRSMLLGQSRLADLPALAEAASAAGTPSTAAAKPRSCAAIPARSRCFARRDLMRPCAATNITICKASSLSTAPCSAFPIGPRRPS